jgi:hypothetical protein
MPPLRNTLGCQSPESVFEAMYFVAVMTLGQKFDRVGQYVSQPSKVFAPTADPSAWPAALHHALVTRPHTEKPPHGF